MAVRTVTIALAVILAIAGSSVQVGRGAPARDTLVVAAGVQFTTFDPLANAHPPAFSVEAAVMETLVARNVKGELVPVLAEDWRVSSDPRVWTFRLRRGVRFQDGTPFNAEAVKANLDRMRDKSLGQPKNSLWTFIEDVRVKSEYEVEVITEQPSGAILALLTDSSANIVSPAALKRFGTQIATNIVGTGPYVFQAPWAPGQDIVLVRNEQYWGPKPKVQRIVVKEIREALTRQALLERGEVDAVIDLPPEAVLRFQRDPNFVVRKDGGTRVAFLPFNHSRPPFNDLRVRKAIHHAIDVKAIIKGVLRDLSVPADNLVAPGVVGYTPDPDYHEYSPDKAKALLAEAGYPNGFTTQLVTPDGRYIKDKETMVAIAGQLKRVGIQADVVPLEWTTFLTQVRVKPDWGMYYWSWPGYTADAAYNAELLLWSENSSPKGFVPFYKNTEVDRLLSNARYITDQKVRTAMLERALKLARNDYAYVYLWRFFQITVLSKRVGGNLEVLADETILFKNVELR